MIVDIQTVSPALADLCRAYHIRRLSLFGSAVRDEMRPDSDVDLLAEFDPNHFPSYFEIVDMSDKLSPLFGNRYVDLVTIDGLHRLIRDNVMREAKILYEG
jgi:hypothetical protein